MGLWGRRWKQHRVGAKSKWIAIDAKSIGSKQKSQSDETCRYQARHHCNNQTQLRDVQFVWRQYVPGRQALQMECGKYATMVWGARKALIHFGSCANKRYGK